MRLRRALAALSALAAVSVATPASAQHFEGRGSLTGAATYNKTYTDSPFPTALTQSGPSATLSPSLSLVYETPLTLNTLTYGFGMNFFFTPDFQIASGGISYNNHASYQGRLTLSELSAITLSFSFSHAPVNTLSVGTDASQSTVDPIPTGAAYTLSASVQEGFTRQMSPEVSLSQTTGVTYAAPYNPLLLQPRTLGVQNTLSLQKQFTRDTLGLSLSQQTSYFTVGEGAGGTVLDAHAQFSNTLSATWNRTLTDAFSTALVAGVTVIVSPGLETPAAAQPTGSLTVNYRLEPAVATLSFSHQSAPNIATGSVNFTDSGLLRFSMPFGDTGLSGTGSGGFTHMAPIGDSTIEPSDVFMADASLSFRPPTSQSLSFGLRGQVQRQTGGLDVNAAFTRVSASFNLTYSYPSAAAGAPPPQLPPTLGAAVPNYGGGSSGGAVEVPSEVVPAAPAVEPVAPKP